jgi:ubiquinone/menaquinone biosynthesis C-methylase UbiE
MNIKESYTEINSKAVDSWVSEGWEWSTPISHETYLNAQNGNWDMLLTPKKNVPHSWFGNLKGAKVLGLASGGGQQMPIFNAAGAICTVMDYSQKQLDQEKFVKERENYEIEIVRADMTKRFPFEDESFDLIFNPVSNIFVEDVLHIWKECYRVLKKGGILLTGFSNDINYIVDESEKHIVEELPFNPLTNKRIHDKLIAAYGAMEFSHTIEEQIQGQLDLGFTMTNIYSDLNSEGYLMEKNIPTFYATRCIK